MTKREKSSFYSSDFWTKEEFLDSAVLRCVIYVITHSTSSWILAFLFSSCLPFCQKKEPQAPADANNMLHHRAPPNMLPALTHLIQSGNCQGRQSLTDFEALCIFRRGSCVAAWHTSSLRSPSGSFSSLDRSHIIHSGGPSRICAGISY